MMDGGHLPSPPRTPESEPFHAAAAEGRFLIRRCTECGKPHWYPRVVCPFCAGPTEWEEASGEATLFTFATLERAKPPYTLAYVELAEGPKMMTNIVNCDPSTLRIGDKVRVVFEAAEDGTAIPCFEPRRP